MPYDPEGLSLEPTPECFEQAKNCVVEEALNVNARIADIKSAISDGLPVIVAARIFDSFANTDHGFVRHPNNDEVLSNNGHGYHAMVICGYSDDERVFVVRNSWGTNFGDNGYCYISYSYALKYFSQCCVITRISNRIEPRKETFHHTLNFNLKDSNIEAAIFRNLIAEDNYELSKLEDEYTELQKRWKQNLGTLINVNNQADIVGLGKINASKAIQEEEQTIIDLQQTKNTKLNDFKFSLLKTIGAFGGLSLLVLVILWNFSHWSLVIILLAFVFIITVLVSLYSWRWRSKRQELRDEIERHSQRLSKLKSDLSDLDYKAHVHGKLLIDFMSIKNIIKNKANKIASFNNQFVSLHKKIKNRLSKMTPELPYPLINVLDKDNTSLDNYYQLWRDKFLKNLNLSNLAKTCENDISLEEALVADRELNNSIGRGLRNFSLMEYLMGTRPEEYAFLSKAPDLRNLFAEMDTRSLPFCQVDPSIPLEKYLLTETGNTTNSPIQNYFQPSPMDIASNDSDSIVLINRVRFSGTAL